MPNRTLFATRQTTIVPRTDAVNEAGGRAYALPPAHALAQYAATGCLNGTYYADAETQLDTALRLAHAVEPETLAKIAVYAAERGRMRDMPALLLAVLSTREPALFARAFPRAIRSARALRTFVQIVRSGQAGRRSLGTAPRRAIRDWLERQSVEDLFNAKVGEQPSLADVIKLVHPRPTTAEREALYGYLIGKRSGDDPALPAIVRAYERYLRHPVGEPPPVRFELLAGLPLDAAGWRTVAARATWQQTRINLNTFVRHGVFDEPGLAETVAARLADPAEIARAGALPYGLLAAYLNAGDNVPAVVAQALATAAEVATRAVPAIAGKAHVLIDVSGSMSSPISGHRKGATSTIQCRQVAALIAAAIVRRNPEAEVIAFHTEAIDATGLVGGTILQTAERLAQLPSGGTDCSAPLRLLNRRQAAGDLVVMVSDYESWAQTFASAQRPGAGVMQEWAAFRARNPAARLVCLDLQPYATVQAPDREEIVNVGGFSDAVFELLALFARGELGAAHWLGEIEAIAL